MTSDDLLMNTDSNDPVYEYLNENGEIVHYDMNRLVFCATNPEKIRSAAPTDKPMLNYRIGIQDRCANGQLQDLLIRTEKLFTYGVSESFDLGTSVLNGYSLPIPLWSQDGATPSQKYFTDFLEKQLLDKVKEHLVAACETFKQPDLDLRDLRKMKMFYRKKADNGAVSLDDPPTWYPKLIVSKKKNMKIVTRFYMMDEHGNSCIDESGNPIELDPMALKGRWGYTRAVIKIEGIYIRSDGCSIQMKVWEADFCATEAALPRKSKINMATATVVKSDSTNPMAVLMMANAQNRAAASAADSGNDANDANDSESKEDEHSAGGDITLTDSPAPALAATTGATAVRRQLVMRKPASAGGK